MQRGQRWQEKLGWRSHTVEVRLETQMQLPRQPRGRWLSAFPVKLTYRDFTGVISQKAFPRSVPPAGQTREMATLRQRRQQNRF